MSVETARCVDVELEDALFLIMEEASHLPFIAAKQHHIWEGGARSAEAANPYLSMMDIIDRAVAALMKARQDTETLSRHTHEWDPENGFCGVCGADGNA